VAELLKLWYNLSISNRLLQSRHTLSKPTFHGRSSTPLRLIRLAYLEQAIANLLT